MTKITMDLTDSEIAYIRNFKLQHRMKPIAKKDVEKFPSIQIFLKIAEVID